MNTYIVHFSYVKDNATCFLCPYFKTGCGDKIQEDFYSVNDMLEEKQVVVKRIKPNPETHCRCTSYGSSYRYIDLYAPYDDEKDFIRVIESETGFCEVVIENIEEVLS